MNYLIVGVSSAIGTALAKKLMQEGHQLWTTSRSAEPPAGINSQNHQLVDVSKDFELDLPERLDGLVYCPGTIQLKPFHRIAIETFKEDYQVNVLGAIQSIQKALAALKKSEAASIVLFSSVAATSGLPFHGSIASAKAAIEGLTRALSAELAPAIRVNAVAPSLTDTPLAARLLSSEDKRKANADRHPLKKIGSADDIAEAAHYLLTNRAAWVSGQVLAVDGGMGVIR